MNFWREPIVFRKVWMAYPFYLLKYHLWAELCFVYSRYQGNLYISDVPKAPPTGREWMCISIIRFAVFVQTSAKILPHKPVLNNILIYTSNSSLFFKNCLKVQLWGLSFYNLYNSKLYIFLLTCISTVNQMLFCGLQHEIIKVSAKLINVNERIPL